MTKIHGPTDIPLVPTTEAVTTHEVKEKSAPRVATDNYQLAVQAKAVEEVGKPMVPPVLLRGADTSAGESFANDLDAAGWDVTWTSITGGSHTWLFQSSYGYTNQDLWDYFAANPIP